MTEPEASGPPPSPEPDILKLEIRGKCEVLIDAAMDEGSLYALTKLSNLLTDFAPSLVAPLMERGARARARRKE